MSLGKKLLGGFGAMLALMLALSGGAALLTNSLNGDVNQAINVMGRQQYLAGVANASASEMASSERGAVLASVLGDKAKGDEYLRRFDSASEKLKQALNDIRSLADGERRSAIDGISQQATLVRQAHEE